MNVGELREWLSDYESDQEVLLSDGRGDGREKISVCFIVDEVLWDKYENSSFGCGDIYATPENIANPDSIWEEDDAWPGEPDALERAVCLWPVN